MTKKTKDELKQAVKELILARENIKQIKLFLENRIKVIEVEQSDIKWLKINKDALEAINVVWEALRGEE